MVFGFISSQSTKLLCHSVAYHRLAIYLEIAWQSEIELNTYWHTRFATLAPSIEQLVERQFGSLPPRFYYKASCMKIANEMSIMNRQLIAAIVCPRVCMCVFVCMYLTVCECALSTVNFASAYLVKLAVK